MDIGRAFNAPFRDNKWFGKAALGGVWAMLVVTAPALYGYQVDYIKRVANGDETPLPEWFDDFGGLWVRGFMVSVALFLYMLPAIILMGIGFVPVMLAGLDGSDAAMAGGMGGACLLYAIAFIYIIAVSYLANAAVVHYAIQGSFGAFFDFKNILARVKSNSGYLTAWGMSIVVAFLVSAVAGIVGGILGAIVVGIILAPWAGGAIGFVGNVITGHLFGQYAISAYGTKGLGAPTGYAAPAGYSAPAGYAAPPAAPVPPAPPAPPVAAPVPPAPPVAAPVPPAPPAAAPVPPAPPAAPVPPAPTAPPAPPAPESPEE